MLGTLIGALEVRQVKLEDDAVFCEAEGLHTIREGLPVLTEIRVRYRLRIPAGSRDTVERVLEALDRGRLRVAEKEGGAWRVLTEYFPAPRDDLGEAQFQQAKALDDTTGFNCYMPYPQKKVRCDN